MEIVTELRGKATRARSAIAVENEAAILDFGLRILDWKCLFLNPNPQSKMVKCDHLVCRSRASLRRRFIGRAERIQQVLAPRNRMSGPMRRVALLNVSSSTRA